MATTPKNRITRSVAPNSLFEDASGCISSATSFNQGDLLVFKSNLLTTTATEADGQYFAGIAVETVSSGQLVSPYTTPTTSTALSVVAGPQFGVTAELILETGSSIAAGDSVYLSTVDAQHVAASGTKPIGIYTGNQGASISGSAAGFQIECYLGARYPNDTLKF